MFLHVRKTYGTLGKADTLMLHVHPDIGSTWQVRPVAAAPGQYLLTSSRVISDGGADCHLHVRKSWARQREDNALMLCHHGNGNRKKSGCGRKQL